MTRADETILECIEGQGTSFLLDAGAGSGKTYSLVKALNHIRGTWRSRLLKHGQKVACITFTNVAKDEIVERTEHDPLFVVSTIHEFLWDAIKSYQTELRKAVIDYNESLPAKSKRKKPTIDLTIALSSIKVVYSDRGSNFLEGRIFHDDLLDIAQIVFKTYPLLAAITSARYRFIFVDEYQDTNEKVISVLLNQIAATNNPPVIGLFGDKMQSIYSEGVGEIPADLQKKLKPIKKEENYRCSKAVIALLNKLRTDIQQQPAGNNLNGSAVYIDLSKANDSEDLVEQAQRIAKETFGWSTNSGTTKFLFLTHRLIARKAGYAELLKVYGDRGGFYQERFHSGEDEIGRFFIEIVEPLLNAWKDGKAGKAISILESSGGIVASAEGKKAVKSAVDGLSALCSCKQTTIGDVLKHIRETKLLPLLDDFILWLDKPIDDNPSLDTDGEIDKEGAFFKTLFQIPYKQIAAYRRVLIDDLPYSTKHGVKGAEFDTVYVVLDDAGANWNQYSFSNFLAGAEKNETRLLRTRNLFYVCCSRAKDRLAVVNLSGVKNGRAVLEALFGADNCVL